MTTADILVVGAGPVGLTAAVGLARTGLRVHVLEQAAELSDLPRASTFHPPTLELLDGLDLAAPLIEEGYVVERIQYRERQEGVVAEFDYRLLADETRYPFRLQCPQNRLAAIAAERLAAHDGCALHFGAEVRDLAQDAEGVTLRDRDGREYRAPWVIGADGASSAVRKLLGIPFEGSTYPTRNLQLITDFDFPRVFPDLAKVNYVFDPREWTVLMRTPPGVWRVLLPVPPAMSDDEALDLDRIQARLRRLVGDPATEVPVRYHKLYTVHQRVAARFRQGRVLLLGDAAHVNSPIGGMGMNSGIHDATTLHARLAAVIGGAADGAALDEWAERRLRVARRFVKETTHRNTTALQETDEAARRRRNADLAAKAADPARARDHLRRASMLDAALEQAS